MLQSLRLRKQIALWVAYAVIIVLCVVEILPIYWVVITSFKTNLDIFGGAPLTPPWHNPTLEHYQYVFRPAGTSSVAVGAYLANSAVITLGTVVTTTVIGMMAAYALARFRFRGRTAVTIGFLLIRMVPPLAVVVPIYSMMRGIGLLNTRVGLLIVYTAFMTSFVIWMMRGFFQEVPVELEEAAMVDGCTRLGALWRIVLPLAAPGIIATAIFSFLGAWNEFAFASLLTSSNASQTATVLIASQISFDQVFWGRIAAIATVLIVPVLIFFALVQRNLVRGLTLGAVK